MTVVPTKGVVISEPTASRQALGIPDDPSRGDKRVSPYRSIDSGQQQDNSTTGRVLAPNAVSTSYDGTSTRTGSHLSPNSVDGIALKTDGPGDTRAVPAAALRNEALWDPRLYPIVANPNTGNTNMRSLPSDVQARRTNILTNAVGPVELAPAAVRGGHVESQAALIDWFPHMSGVGRVLPGGAASGGANPVMVRNENILGVGADKVSGILSGSNIPGLHAAKIVAGVFGSNRLGTASVHYDEVHNDLQNGPMNLTSMRFVGTFWGGTSTYAASNNHAHASLYLDQMPLDVQGAVLDLRKRVRSRGRLEDIKQLVLVLCSMAMDEEHESADERLERIKDNPEAQEQWANRWWDDRGDGEDYYPPEGAYLDPPEDWPRGDQEEREQAMRWRGEALNRGRSMGSLQARAVAATRADRQRRVAMKGK